MHKVQAASIKAHVWAKKYKVHAHTPTHLLFCPFLLLNCGWDTPVKHDMVAAK